MKGKQSRKITETQKKIVAASQLWRCAICKKLLDSTFQVDHIIPLFLGGDDNYKTNCQSLCVSCHSHKTQRELVEYNLQRKRKHNITYKTYTCNICNTIFSPFFSHDCHSL